MSARPESPEAVAEVLREHPPALDELSKARLERRLVASSQASSGPSPAPSRAARRGPWIAVGLGLAAAAAALAVLLRPGEPAAPVARFEVREVTSSAQRGTLEEGSVLPTGPGEVAEVRIGDSRVRLAPGGRLSLATLAPGRLDLELTRGEVRVGFHPRERGREHLSVTTPEARVEVVGTVFTVRARGGVTEVRVSEGTVRVVPRDGGEARLVRAGGSTRVASPRAAAAEDHSSAPAGTDDGSPAAGSVARGAADDVSPAAGSVERGAPRGRAGTDERASPERGVTGASPSGPDEGRAAAGSRAGSPPGTDGPSASAPADAPRPSASTEARAAGARALARARRTIAEGHPERAESELRRVAESDASRGARAEAWTLLGDLAQRRGRHAPAAHAYRRAAALCAGTMVGSNAVFALARLQERRLHDDAAARGSYARYLRDAPEGPLADRARRALCRLGDEDHCEPER
ncbi:MAG TPA: FecR domain-containing protein [Sandaracinaceae bacterium LLY-WYZ-13_1]|nr:FecR domain-containing protein [Sandaracinaceae bacterium LLY-WYZ-13_1]